MNGNEIAIAYFRAGYVPAHYPSELEWVGREKIELSRAVKCPNVDFHLAGCKKIQQCLSNDMAKFTSDPHRVIENTTEIYDFSTLDEVTVQRVQENPKDWVLKPQREGGGNNTYGDDILEKLKMFKEMKDYILMKLIHCKESECWAVRKGELKIMEAVSEVGMFGAIIARGNEVLVNEYAGYLVRTKSKESNEGGIAAGFAVLDSASLI